MKIKEFFKPTKGKVIITIFVFIIILVFFFPAKMNLICKPNSNCPQVNEFINIFLISEISAFAGVSYSYMVLEALVSYLISLIIIYTYMRLLNKNRK